MRTDHIVIIQPTIHVPSNHSEHESSD